MWPFRPERLTDVVPEEDLRHLLALGDLVGSAVTLVEKNAVGELVSFDPDRSGEERRPDPFCTYFRHGKAGGEPAFEGADEACARCEQRLARRLLTPADGTAGSALGPGILRQRCHMGLTDHQAPVLVAGKVVASVIAGRRIEAEDDRQRIRKSAGKLGKLTRAEAGSADAGDRILVQPADEKARDRLIQEIASIPLRSEDLEKRLIDAGKFLGRIAWSSFETFRRSREDALVERIDGRRGELPKSFADLRRDLGVLLDVLRAELQVEYLAFFAQTPKELDDAEARASLVAESGLQLQTGKRLLELDWSRLPAEPPGLRSAIARGLDAVSSTVSALLPTRDTPSGLKDRLTKCIFFAPVEMGSHLRSALAIGAVKSSVPPVDADYHFLARLARAVSRRYFAFAAEVERRWLAEHLAAEGAARKEAESARRVLARTAGFTHFDLRKLVDQSLERSKLRAQERGVEVDARALLDRLTVHGDRPALGQILQRLLNEGIERSLAGPEPGRNSPLRVFLKRTRHSAIFGVEAVGDFLSSEERRALFARDDAAERTAESAPEGQRAPHAGAPRRSFSDIIGVLRRHEGRLRVDSERLHRLEGDNRRWVGKTMFLVDLPLPGRGKEGEQPQASSAGTAPATPAPPTPAPRLEGQGSRSEEAGGASPFGQGRGSRRTSGPV